MTRTAEVPEGDVLPVQVVEVARDRARLAELDLSGPPAERVPDARAATDKRDVGGRIDDLDRIVYLDSYLRAVVRAMAEGVPVLGYVWSLLDNFEWSLGYSKHFGIVYIGYETLEGSRSRVSPGTAT